MRSGRITYKQTALGCIICVVQLLLFTGCIGDRLGDCLPQYLLYITVSDNLTGEDATEIESFDNVMLYLFNSNHEFVQSIEVTTEQINNRIPVDLTGMGVENGYAVVWANMDENSLSMTDLDQGSDLTDRSLFAKDDDDHPDYLYAPSDLFHGYQPLSDQGSLKVTQNIDIQRKNGQLHITARGMSVFPEEDHFYFKVKASHSGYCFSGEPIANEHMIYATGMFTNNDEFVTSPPCNIIPPSSSSGIIEAEVVTIYLMRVDPYTLEETEVFVTNTDAYGELIWIISGETTNVLIQIDDEGGLVVGVVITPWDVINQWDIW